MAYAKKSDERNYHRQYRERNREKVRKEAMNWVKAHPEKAKQQRREVIVRLKDKFFSLYGKACQCCGETIREFLTLDHIKGQHKSLKESTTTAMRRALREYRPDLFRVLCMNCNHSYGLRGYCPHQSK